MEGLIYLGNGAISYPKPVEIYDYMDTFYRRFGSTPAGPDMTFGKLADLWTMPGCGSPKCPMAMIPTGFVFATPNRRTQSDNF